MAIAVHDIDGESWTPITAPGKGGTCWLQEIARTGQVVINHSDTLTTFDVDGSYFLLNAKRKQRHISAESKGDIYYARCSAPGNTAVLITDTGLGFIGDPIGKVIPESNGAWPVNIQDQTTRAFDTRVSQFDKIGITLASPPIVDSYDVTLTTGHGVIIDDRIAIFEQNGLPQLYSGLVLNVVGDVVTIDTPVPFAFTIGATVVTTIIEMSVDGSAATEVFSITNIFEDAVDITRLIIHITDTTAMDDSKFGGGDALTRGLVMRKKVSEDQYINYWNVKNNGEFGELAYDKSYDSKAPAGLYGLTVRLTYNGQAKHGVVIRLEPGETIEILVQDDLTGLETFTIMFQGHSTQE